MSHLARDGLVECFEIAQADRQHRKYVASTRPTKSRRNCKHWSHWSYCTKNKIFWHFCCMEGFLHAYMQNTKKKKNTFTLLSMLTLWHSNSLLFLWHFEGLWHHCCWEDGTGKAGCRDAQEQLESMLLCYIFKKQANQTFKNCKWFSNKRIFKIQH